MEIGVVSPIPVDIPLSGTWPDLSGQLAEVRQFSEGNRIEVGLPALALDLPCPPDCLVAPMRMALPVNRVELPEGEDPAEVKGVSTSLRWPPSP